VQILIHNVQESQSILCFDHMLGNTKGMDTLVFELLELLPARLALLRGQKFVDQTQASPVVDRETRVWNPGWFDHRDCEIVVAHFDTSKQKFLVLSFDALLQDSHIPLASLEELVLKGVAKVKLRLLVLEHAFVGLSGIAVFEGLVFDLCGVMA
jgi:hypothetical protein